MTAGMQLATRTHSITCELYLATADHKKTGSALASASTIVSEATGVYDEYTWIFVSKERLTAGTLYLLYFSPTVNDFSYAVGLYGDNTQDGYAAGKGAQYVNDSFSSFLTNDGDHWMKIYGYPVAQWYAWPQGREVDYDPNDWWSDSAYDWVASESPSLPLSDLMVGAGLQNNIVAVGADTSTGKPIIYFGTS
jgi:hypothetical protein